MTIREIAPDEKNRLQNLMKKGFIPGMSVASVKNGELDFAATFGVSDNESQSAANKETIFWACSLSKPVFAYLVIKLIESGKLGADFNLDSPLWDADQFGEIKERKPLTPRMLLSHQTGLPNQGPPIFSFNPGEAFSYSGEGYFYLQKIIEERTHLSLEELARQNIFDPLDMKNSTFLRPDAEKIAENHDEQMHHQPRIPTLKANDNNAAASLHTTASDYAKFISACLHDPAFNQMTSSEVSMIVDEDALSKNIDSGKLELIDWGLGFGIQKPNQENENTVAFHWGHGPGARTFVAINKETKSAVVYLTNSENGLSIAEDIISPTVGNIHASMDYLSSKYGYEQHDSPKFSAKHAEEKKEVDSSKSNKRIQWLDELVYAKAHPLEIDKNILQSYTGEYGPQFPMSITLVDDGSLQLVLYGQKHQLIPINETTFVSKNDLTIRLEFDSQKSQVSTHFLYQEKITQNLLSKNKFVNLHQEEKLHSSPHKSEQKAKISKNSSNKKNTGFLTRKNKPIDPADEQMAKSAFGQESNLARTFRRK